MKLSVLLDGTPIAFEQIDFFECEVTNTSCSTKNCTVDGFWSSFGPFSEWSTCSQTCGGGQQNRTQYRTCTDPPQSEGDNVCEGPEHNTETRQCNEQDCPVYGTWTEFQGVQNWSQCSVSCGEGKQSRIKLRTCISSVVIIETEVCNGSAFEQEIRACIPGECPSGENVAIVSLAITASVVLIILSSTVCVCYRRQMKSRKVLSSHQTTREEETEPMHSHYNYITAVLEHSDTMNSVYEEIVDLSEGYFLSPNDTGDFTNLESERETNETSLTEHQYSELGKTSRECPYDVLKRSIFSETITNDAA